MKNHKFTIILTVVILALAAFLAGYFITEMGIKSQGEPDLKTGNILQKFGENSDSQPAEPGSPVTGTIGSNQAVSPVNSPDKSSVLYYGKNSGQVFEIDLLTGVETAYSEGSLSNFVKTFWSPDKETVISLFNDPKNGQVFKYYNYGTKRTAVLPSKVKSVAFSPQGDRVVYFATEDSGNSIVLSQPDGTYPKKILETRLQDMEISWPGDNLIALTVNKGVNTRSLLTLTKEGQLEKVLDYQTDLQIKWSRDGSALLYSITDSDNSKKLFYKKTGDIFPATVSISTSASKCAWSINNKEFLCAVPVTAASHKEDLIMVQISEKLPGINPEFLTKTMAQNLNIFAEEMLLSTLEDFAVLLNGLDGRLYSVPLFSQ